MWWSSDLVGIAHQAEQNTSDNTHSTCLPCTSTDCQAAQPPLIHSSSLLLRLLCSASSLAGSAVDSYLQFVQTLFHKNHVSPATSHTELHSSHSIPASLLPPNCMRATLTYHSDSLSLPVSPLCSATIAKSVPSTSSTNATTPSHAP